MPNVTVRPAKYRVGGGYPAQCDDKGFYVRASPSEVFTCPLDIEWFQTVPPPKVAPRVVASSIVSALKRGLEDVFVGDVAEDIRQRLAANPKAVERELGA